MGLTPLVTLSYFVERALQGLEIIKGWQVGYLEFLDQFLLIVVLVLFCQLSYVFPLFDLYKLGQFFNLKTPIYLHTSSVYEDPAQ